MDRKAHWETVYNTKDSATVSWYQATPTRSLELLRQISTGPETAIIDIGGGDSTLVDSIVAERLGQVTVVDISAAALARARERLKSRAGEVKWMEVDVTDMTLPPQTFDVWHDRAVFHFLTVADDRKHYVAIAASVLRSGGSMIIATFAPDGPTRCSGLDVVRYSAGDLAKEFGDAFILRHSFIDTHRTPNGAEQEFTYALFERT